VRRVNLTSSSRARDVGRFSRSFLFHAEEERAGMYGRGRADCRAPREADCDAVVVERGQAEGSIDSARRFLSALDELLEARGGFEGGSELAARGDPELGEGSVEVRPYGAV
jgi:hypothetical protein